MRGRRSLPPLERSLALGSLVLLVLSLLSLWGGGGGLEVADPTAGTGPREYHAPSGRSVDLPRDGFDLYWKGREIFSGEVSSALPLPVLPPIEPRLDAWVAPPVQPGVAEAGRKGVASDFLFLSVDGSSPIIPADLLPAEAAALAAQPEPEMAAPVDHRHERETELDILFRPDGDPIRGVIFHEDAEAYHLHREGDTKRRETWPRARISRVERRSTYEEKYAERRKSLAAGDGKARLALAIWCLETEVRKDGAPTGEKLNMRAEAKSELKELLSQQKDHSEAVLLLGRLHQEDAEYGEAVALYQEALGVVRGTARGEILRALGDCYESVGVPELALESYRESYRESPRQTSPRIGAARIELERGDYEAAIREIDGAVGYDPKAAQAFVLRGRAHLALGRLPQARADVVRALGLRPNDPAGLTLRSSIDLLEGRVREAGAGFVEAVRADPYAIDAWNALGSLHLAAGKTAEGAAIFTAAVQRDPSSPAAAGGRALSLWLQGDAGKARESAKQACEAFPTDAYVSYIEGGILLRAGEDAAALECFQRSLRSDFSFLPVHYPAALAHLREATRREGLLSEEKDEKKRIEGWREQARLRSSAELLLTQAAEGLKKKPDALLALAGLRLSAGRTAEASRFLLEGRRIREDDPLTLYALGYYEQRAGAGEERKRIESAVGFFRRGAAISSRFADPGWVAAAQRCGEAARQLGEWLLTRVVLEDHFDRPDGREIGNKWIERDRNYGIAVTLEGGQVKFDGKQVNRDMGVTSLEREVSRENLHLLEVTILPQEMEDAEVGVSLYTGGAGTENRAGFHLGRAMDGRLGFAMTDEASLDGGTMQSGWEMMDVPLPDPKAIRLRFQKGEKTDGVLFEIRLWDASRQEWKVIRKDIPVQEEAQPVWKFAIWGRGYRDRAYDFRVDDVRIYERRKR